MCTEYGVGLSGGIEADLFGATSSGASTLVEIGAKAFGTGVSVGVERPDCASLGDIKFGVKAGIGPVGLAASNQDVAVTVGVGLELGGKIARKNCGSISF